jgi:hypothetical protein
MYKVYFLFASFPIEETKAARIVEEVSGDKLLRNQIKRTGE